jgi:hypothetical protein
MDLTTKIENKQEKNNNKIARKRRSDYGKKKEFDKNSIQYLKYRDIAIEFIKNGYSNIREIYAKFYPKASNESIDTAAYQLLDNLRFHSALEDAWNYIKIDDLNIARDVIRCLQKEMFTAKNSADRINAASWLGKSKALFTDKQEIVPTDKSDNQFSLDRLAGIKKADTQ